MKNWKKILSVAVTGAFILNLSTGAALASPKQGWDNHKKSRGYYNPGVYVAPAAKAKATGKINLKDINGHWAQGAMAAVYMQGIVKGYSDQSFKPEGTITKNEALTMLANLMGADASSDNRLSFGAARNVPEWAGGSLAVALDKGILTRDELSDYNGNAAASRYEVAAWMARALGLDSGNAGSLPFTDANQIPSRYRNCVANIYNYQIMTGYPGGYFRPHQPIKRGEMASLMMTLLANAPVNPFYQVVKGKVKEVDDDSITLFAEPYRIHPKFVTWQDLWNLLRNETYSLSEDVVVFLNSKLAEPEDINKGANVSLVLNKDGEVIIILATGKVDQDDDEDDDQDTVTGAPTVKTLNPADGAANVDPDIRELRVTFSENIEAVENLADVKAGIEVKNTTDNEDISIDDVYVSGATLEIELDELLEPDKTYRVTIDQDVLQDRDGNKFEGISSGEWDFTTGDGENPTIAALIPSHQQGYVNTALKTLTVKFSENIKPVSNLSSVAAGIQVKNTSKNVVLTLDSTTPVTISGDTMIIFLKDSLEKSNTYGVTIEDEVLEDESGNDFTGIAAGAWTFTTDSN